ncbi:contractile injection system tape measure protein [Zoogloea sp.]|uniref:contractile injection system tape measure protein n=1 Tax=Zoogloea sp. TaxID=49181 RepID=UPI002623686B|nr:contractile injection system tape measure protein [Zoogloea sp.]
MNAPLPHRIRRLHWQARAPTPDAAFALRSLLREGSDAVLAALERSLSAQVPDTRLIHLPRLELHLRLNPADSADDLPERVFAAATAAIAAALADLDTATTPPAEPATGVATGFVTEYSSAPARNIPGQPPPSNAVAPLPVAAALALDALCRSAPAELHAAIANALKQAGIDTGAHPAPIAAPIELRLRDQSWLLPPATLHSLFINLTATLAAEPAPRHASARPAPTARPAADPGSPARAGKAEVANPAPNPAPDALPLHAQASLALYLHSGSLDWTLAGLAPERVLAILRDAALVWARLGALPACLFALPSAARPGALARWLALLPPDAYRPLAALAPAPANARRPLSTALRRLLAAHTPNADYALALWLTWTMEPEHSPAAHAAWCDAMLGGLENLFAGSTTPAPWQPVLALLRAPAEAHADDAEAPDSKLGPNRPQPARAHPPATQPAPASAHLTPPAGAPASATAPPPRPAFDAHPPRPDPAGFVVPAAGLVLLHPYLPRLLDATGLYPAGSRGPLANAALPAAAALLHGLASGQGRPHEFELGFIKVLLGHAPDTPLPHAPPPLTDSQRTEADALLDAVIIHWQALRGTSVAGLRTSFLQRRGHLEKRDDTWLLRVEPESFDILLGLLPWGIGLVRLPWMSRPLCTEWTTP